MADRLSQVAGHLSNSHSRGLLADEVAIVTGKELPIVKAVHFRSPLARWFLSFRA